MLNLSNRLTNNNVAAVNEDVKKGQWCKKRHYIQIRKKKYDKNKAWEQH